MTWSVIQSMISSCLIPVLLMLGVWELWNLKHIYLTTLKLCCAVAVWHCMVDNIKLFLSISNSALLWLPGGWPVGYLHSAVEEFNLGWLRTNPMNDREGDLHPGPPDYKSSTLTTLPLCLLAVTQCSWGVQLGVTENKSNEWQGRGLTPRTTRLQVQHPNHSATLPPSSLFEFIWQFLENNVLVYPQALHHQFETSFLNKQRASAGYLICEWQREIFFIWTAHGNSLTPGLLNSSKGHCIVFWGKTLTSHIIMPWENCQKKLTKWQGRVGLVGDLQWANILSTWKTSLLITSWAGNWV